MKILLLTPPIRLETVYGLLAPAAPSLPPLGLCSLAAVLLREGHEIKIIDAAARGLSIEKILEEARFFSPQVIGISSSTCSYPQAKNLLSQLKELLPDSRLILGGAHISALPQKTMEECPSLDIGVVGEGEITLKEVVERLTLKKVLSSLPGIVYRDNSEIIRTPPRPSIKNLDELPPPARYLLGDMSVYRPTPLRGKGRTTSLITSRGCSFHCSYCDQSVFGTTWRGLSAPRIVAEMKELIYGSGIEFVSFEDDNFLYDKGRVSDLCELLRSEKIRIKWGCSVRVEDIETDLVREMKNAGCRYIYLGIESGSPRVLKILVRNPDLSRVKTGVIIIKQAGILAYGAFMMGLPTETKEELAQTQRLALTLPLDGIFIFQYTPYPGTRLRELAIKTGWVSPRWEDYSAHLTNPAFRSHTLSPREVREWIIGTYKRFFFRPRMLGRIIPLMGQKRSWKIMASLLLSRKKSLKAEKKFIKQLNIEH